MIEKIKSIAIIILLLAIAVMAAVSIALLPGCMTSPELDDYTTAECFSAADCLYRIKSADEKSPCSFLTEACRDSLKERARIYRLEYCKDKRPADMTERECRSWINER